jgi:hypothetical protein
MHCLDIVFNQYMEFYWNVRDHDEPAKAAVQAFFKGCLLIGNTRLITQFQGKIYEQLNGLAMGVADSPDLANLYGVHFEEKCKVLEQPDIPFYGRYIDDCLGIVYADDEASAVRRMQDLVKFDNCVIEWSASGSHAPFLDMLLLRDVNDGTLQHMPYRKSGNHQERIPWISAHPYDVKRGTFLGEMSRLATLCSKLEYYKGALRGLVRLYIERGYPVEEVHKWLSVNISKRWKNRLVASSSGRDADVLVLKTQYNFAWNYFNSTQLGEQIFGYWREWLERADRGDFNEEFPAPDERDRRVSDWQQHLPGTWDLREYNNNLLDKTRVILSRKRTRNFLDVSNTWKRTVLETLEDQTIHDFNRQVETAARYGAQKRPVASDDVNTTVTGPALKRRGVATDVEVEEGEIVERPVAHRGLSPGPSNQNWSSGAMGSWARGSRPF